MDLVRITSFVSRSTKKHRDTVAENKYPKEYVGYVLGKLNYEEICNLFKVSDVQVGNLFQW